MTKSAEYLREADECKRWAEQTRNHDYRERWLQLAGKWLELAQDATSEAAGLTVIHGGSSREQA